MRWSLTITGTSGTITVGAASAATLAVTGPATATAGVSFPTLSVTALDAISGALAGKPWLPPLPALA